MTPKVYVISKVKHAQQWQFLRDRSEGLFTIISTWIDDGLEADIDFSEAWPRYLKEASSANFVIVHIDKGDVLKGGMAELGAALSHGAIAYVDGDVESLRTMSHHPNVHHTDMSTAVENIILASGGFKGRYVNEYV